MSGLILIPFKGKPLSALLLSASNALNSNANQDGRLHSKIVEILASTTNGCIEELGYHPAMMEKLQQATQLVQLLQEDNRKLYEDNCRLAASFQMMKERATHLVATPNTQLQQFSVMQERIRTLESERITLARQNQDILLSVNKGTSHQHLVEELDRMRAYANRVCRDMQILQDKYAMATQRGRSSPGVLSPSSWPFSVHCHYHSFSNCKLQTLSLKSLSPEFLPLAMLVLSISSHSTNNSIFTFTSDERLSKVLPDSSLLVYRNNFSRKHNIHDKCDHRFSTPYHLISGNMSIKDTLKGKFLMAFKMYVHFYCFWALK
jgi:FtsZ-binding cell division protein ZapB